MRRSSGLILTAVLLTVLEFHPGAPKTGVLGSALAAAQSVGTWDSGAEYQIFYLLNQDRTQRGLARLRFDEQLTAQARKHSELMAQRHQLAHQFPDEPELDQRLGSAGLHFDYSGENVALNETAAGANDGLMNSPPHRANILNPNYSAVGIGVVRVGKQIWITQDFANLLPKSSPAEAEAQIARQFNELRQNGGGRPLPLIANPKLRDLACNMARHDDLGPSKAGALPGVARVVTFTVANLTRTPEYMRQAAVSPASGFSVGACFATSKSYANAVYWVILTIYF